MRYILIYINVLRFFFLLRRGDVVYTYGITPATKLVLRRCGVKVFAEQTEHLSILTGGKFSLTQKEKIKVAKSLNGLIVISEALKRYFIEIGVQQNKILTVNMIVDSGRFIGLNKIKGKTRYIAYCGTISNHKDGVDCLIKAFSIVAAKVPDVKLYIIGNVSYSEEMVANIKLIRSLGLEERIVLPGVIPARDMPQILKDATVLALARPNNIQATYGFPTKLGEYLLTENPVVLSRVGDMDYFLRDKESAIFAKPDDYKDFAEQLIWVLNNEREALKIGKRGASVALQFFNNELETRKLIDFIFKEQF